MSGTQPKIYWTKVPTRMYDPNFDFSYITGRKLVIPASTGSQRDVFALDFSGSLIKFALHMSSYTDGDMWNISGSDWVLCKNIYTKNVPESFVLEIGRYLGSGSELVFDFFNTGSQGKSVWLDYYFIKG